ncbi:hypothetical protein BJX62DRAFT_245661 [Aspergillus germanicus]
MPLDNITLPIREIDSPYPTSLTNALAPPYGYALRRNGTCLPTSEVSCGNNWADWYTCCPAGTVCGENNTCCPSDADCSAPLAADPHCANNGTWDLYYTSKYVCCLSGKWGFYQEGLVVGAQPTGGHGCADMYPVGTDVEVLVPLETGTAYSSVVTGSLIDGTVTSSSSISITDMSPTLGDITSTPDTMDAMDHAEDSPSNGSSNTGAVVGGVIGGILALSLIIALVWFLMRRRRQAGERQPINIPGKDFDVYPVELEYTAVRAELCGNQTLAHELPTVSTPRR